MQCYNCGKQNLPNIIYCIDCGTQIKGAKIDYKDENKKYFIQTLCLFLCIVTIIIISIITDIPFLKHDYLFSSLLTLVTVVFAVLDFKSFKKIFRFTFHFKPFLQIIFVACVLAITVNFLANKINQAIGSIHFNTYELYQLFSPDMYLFGLFFTAIVPGFIEEFLFRGILFNHLLRLTTGKITIIVTSILFAFVHFSFFSLIWLTAIGLFLGYLRLRYRTIFYSIFFHALYNSTIFFVEMLDKQAIHI